MSNTLSILKNIFAEVLLCPENELNIDKPYVDMGVDSILAIQISKYIQIKLGYEVLPSELYNFLSINDLTEYLNLKVKDSNKVDYNNLLVLPKNTNKTLDDDLTEDKIAIIGIAGRFPGADNVNEYWDNLLNGISSVTKSLRWNNSNEVYKGGFIKKAKDFDADFFNISPREALLMDPQQRLLLEISWQAFEDAGLSIDRLSGSNCGVFTTSLPGDYKYKLYGQELAYSSFSFLGNAAAVVAGRISHFFNLKGPSLNIDTACSSSLVSIYLAANHLKNNLCDTALVGASSIFTTPEIFKLADSSKILSKTGLCHTFDEKADGFVPSEVVACVVLCRLSDALRNGKQVYAIIEGVEVNHDGYTNGLMSPSSAAQQQLIVSTYQKHKIHTSKIGYIEAHGTGTKLGDPIEVNALREAFENCGEEYSSFIGSSKTNIGHSLVSSGMASLLKVIMSFKHEIIPPHLNYINLNSQIKLGCFKINSKPEKWPSHKEFAAISAFGFSGTNAHLVLSKVAKTHLNEDIIQIKPYLFIFTAKTTVSLINLLKSYLPFLKSKTERDLGNISYSLSYLLTRLEQRFVTVAETINELCQNILDFLEKSTSYYKLPANMIPKEELLNNLANHHQFDNYKLRSTLENVGFYMQSAEIISLDKLYGPGFKKVSLPEYSFSSKPFWLEEENNISDNEVVSLSELSNHTKQKTLVYSKEEIVTVIKQKLADLLEHRIENISDLKPLTDYGVDSLVALQLLEPFTKSCGPMSPNVVFEYNNISSLADHLINCSFDQKAGNVLTNKGNLVLQKKLNILGGKRKLQVQNEQVIEWWIFGQTNDFPLLLLPPLNTLAHVWIQQIRYFCKKNFQVFIPHYPGHGESGFIENNLEQIARNLLESFYSITTTRRNKFSIVGWSLGGCISLHLSHMAPEQIEKMVLVNTAAKFNEDLFAQSTKLRSELLEQQYYLESLYNEQTQNPVDHISAGCSLEILKHYYSQLQIFDMLAILPSLKTKTLVVYGDQDSVINAEAINGLRTIPNNAFKNFINDGHFVPLSSPYIFNKMLESFFIARSE